jgi:hypothetical protein
MVVFLVLMGGKEWKWMSEAYKHCGYCLRGLRATAQSAWSAQIIRWFSLESCSLKGVGFR